MIGIINYGSGNVQAIATLYKRLNIKYKIVVQPQDLKTADKLILPGVGSFDATMQQLIDSGMREELDDLVLSKKMPILGICVGLQVMGNGSDEGNLPGLAWIPGNVRKFDERTLESKPKLPHMGWNRINDKRDHTLFKEVDHEFGFYFVHSFHFECSSESNVLATSIYGKEFTSAIYSENIMGTQFHPEKSHSNGALVLKNFAKI